MIRVIGESIYPVAQVDRWLAGLIARMHGNVRELALILHPTDRAVMMFARADDPHVAMIAMDPEAGVADGPVVGIEIVDVVEAVDTPIPIELGTAGEVVEVVIEERG